MILIAGLKVYTYSKFNISYFNNQILIIKKVSGLLAER